MVSEEILQSTLVKAESHEEFMTLLEKKAAASRTSKMWIQNLIVPTFIMMAFVRAEREADWLLHLWSVQKMLPYFFAAGHWNYASYGLFYLHSMERLPHEIKEHFINGEHVMHHNDGFWNGIWSDMYIETTFMRYGHGPQGIIGNTLKQSAMKKWALSLHTCSKIKRGIAEMTDRTSGTEVFEHKEEKPACIQSDCTDRSKIKEKLSMCMDPLDSTNLPDGVVNIVSGRISWSDVNVDGVVALGSTAMQTFESKLPEGFHESLSTKVVLMSAAGRKQIPRITLTLNSYIHEWWASYNHGM